MLFNPGQFIPTAVLSTNFHKGGTLPSIPNFRVHLKLTVQCFLETPLLIFDSIVRHAACRVWTGNKEWLPTAPSWKRFLYSLTQQHCHGGAQKGIWEYFFLHRSQQTSKCSLFIILLKLLSKCNYVNEDLQSHWVCVPVLRQILIRSEQFKENKDSTTNRIQGTWKSMRNSHWNCSQRVA